MYTLENEFTIQKSKLLVICTNVIYRHKLIDQVDISVAILCMALELLAMYTAMYLDTQSVTR